MWRGWGVLGRQCVLIALLLVLMSVPGRALAEKRVALVIGNGAYKAQNLLINPPNDARLISQAHPGWHQRCHFWRAHCAGHRGPLWWTPSDINPFAKVPRQDQIAGLGVFWQVTTSWGCFP